MATATKSSVRGGVGTKVVSVVAAAALALSMVPATALGSVISFTAPTSPKDGTTGEYVTIDGEQVAVEYVTSGVHAAAEPIAYMMGMDNLTYRQNSWTGNNLTLADAQTDARCGMFGTEMNENPDTLVWNVFYNCYASENDLETTDYIPVSLAGGSPSSASSGSVSESCMPDVLVGISSNSAASSYDATVATLSVNNDDDETNDYDPYMISYDFNSYTEMIESVYAMAYAGNAVISESQGAKTGRYGDDFTEIAEDYESMILGTQYYILSQIDAGATERLSFAYINSYDTSAQTITLQLSNTDEMESGAQNPGRVVAAIQNCADNVGNVYEEQSESSENQMGSTTTVTLTAQQLVELDPDVIVIAGQDVSGAGAGDDAGASGEDTTTQEALISIFQAAGLEESTYSDFRYMNSLPAAVGVLNSNGVENALDVAAVLTYIYNDVIDQADCLAWYYKNLYHIADESLADAIDTMCYQMSTADEGGTTFDANYEEIIDSYYAEGWAYYEANSEELVAEYPNLISYQDYLATLDQVADDTVALSPDEDSLEYTTDEEGNVTYSSYYPTILYTVGIDTTMSMTTDYTSRYYDVNGDRVYDLCEPGVYIIEVTGIHDYSGVAYLVLTLNGTDGTAGDDEGTTASDLESVIETLRANNAQLAAQESYEDSLEEDEGEAFLFDDVQNEDSYYYDAVYALYDEGYITGYDETTYGVGDDMTRVQVVNILYRMAGSPDVTYTDGTFSDVTSDKYYASAVAWAYEEGVTTGTDDKEFLPNDSITRQEMFVMVARYINGGTDVTASDSATTLATFTDADEVNSYAEEAVAWCVENGLVTGTDSGELNPQDVLTREMGATVLYRGMDQILALS